MNRLSVLSGALSCELPGQSIEQGTDGGFPFPGNVAVALAPNERPCVGGSESAWLRVRVGAGLPFRKPPQREGVTSEFLASSRQLWESFGRQFDAEIAELKAQYVFRNEDEITQFVWSHRAVTAVLLNALPQLKSSFGEDIVLKLETVADDVESASLFAVVLWRGPAEPAEIALNDFDERWCLAQPVQPGVTFTYELA